MEIFQGSITRRKFFKHISYIFRISSYSVLFFIVENNLFCLFLNYANTRPIFYFLQHPSIQTDTRKLQSGGFVFCLKGPNFNGNLFAKQALDAGAAFAIIDEPVDFIDNRLIPVSRYLTSFTGFSKTSPHSI
jgi:UDP-N-acetylmuramyl pentapeptide synthase